ncbi:hypothetical protein [Streptomyces sp. NPDC089799]|uniref:hypothetical protein n=1 Tax=Streptomyces sp. NPDC089799 TaxID=3155066 RepID=UPI003426E0F6
MNTVRRTLVRAAAVAACAGSVLALPVAAALADTAPAAALPQTLVKSPVADEATDAAVAADAADAADAARVTPSGSGRIEGGRKTATRPGVPRPGPAETLRLNTLADDAGDGVLLVAAGGGMAAVGAAGLGFAMLRRGRTDG